MGDRSTGRQVNRSTGSQVKTIRVIDKHVRNNDVLGYNIVTKIMLNGLTGRQVDM